ncbi:hypothetical protein AAFC00_002681 [Neodothiora populina]|uniref:Uncharacterized protein n=1 Tax=Neodothiora populina TaxID=2781224 RepID=A0ABR3P962_9PEZI
MIPWSTVQSLVIFFGPILLPKVLAFYRSIRAPSTQPPTPLPSSTSRALNILFACAFFALVSTLPFFSPPNIFTQTSSRLQTPTNVLFTRLAALHSLTPSEESLRAVFERGGLEARLLYFRFGPDVLASSAHIIADPRAGDAGIAYLVFALPSLLAPHLFHLAILGVVTSAVFAGRDAARWRTAALISGVALALADVAATATYDHGVNARATRPGDVDAFFWKRRLVARLAVCATDGLLGWMVYLTATKRAFVEPLAAAERVEAATRSLEGVLARLRGLGAVRNVVFRDTMLRGKLERYWVQEQEVMRAVFEDREVVAALNDTLNGADMGRIEGDADTYVENILGNVRVVQAPG